MSTALLMLTIAVVGETLEQDLVISHRSACYSCASYAYLPLWPKLMHHYFPPKNFTDRCWQPDYGIETVQCTSACFTLVEDIDQQDYALHSEYQGVLRGCVDRLLLFGLDDDVRNVLTTAQRTCRTTDRKLLRLYALSGENELVTFCSCTGDRCNDQDMLLMLNTANLHLSFIKILLISIIATIIAT